MQTNKRSLSTPSKRSENYGMREGFTTQISESVNNNNATSHYPHTGVGIYILYETKNMLSLHY